MNCFTKWLIRGPLTEKQTFYAVAIFTNGHGNITAKLEIERLDTAVSIFRREFTIPFKDPFHQPSCLIRVRHLVFPVAGAYQVMLYVGDECLMLRRFSVTHEEENA